MQKEELNKMIQIELGHIPENGDIQNELRLLYNLVRRKLKWRSKSKEEVLEYCIEQLLGANPSFKPKFDRDFFKVTRF